MKVHGDLIGLVDTDHALVQGGEWQFYTIATP